MQTQDSKQTTEIDAFATTESLIVAIIASFVVWKIGTSAAFLGWALFSPLALLRSPRADKLSRDLFNRMMPTSRADGGVWTIIIYSQLALASVLARLIATARYLPHGLMRLPDNWSRAIFRTSIFDAARFTPDGDTVTHRLKLYTVASKRVFVSSITNQIWLMAAVAAYASFLLTFSFGAAPNWIDILIRLTFFVFLVFAIGQSVGFICHLLAMSYRISLKASALFWLPLVFAIHGGFGSQKSIKEILLDRQVAPLSRVGHWLAVLGVTTGCVKFIVVPSIVGNAPNEFHLLLPDFLIKEPAVWELVFFICSLSTVLLSVLIVAPGPRRLDQGIWSARFVRNLYNVVTLILGCLTIYTSIAAIDVFAPIVPKLKLVSGVILQWWPG